MLFKTFSSTEIYLNCIIFLKGGYDILSKDGSIANMAHLAIKDGYRSVALQHDRGVSSSINHQHADYKTEHNNRSATLLNIATVPALFSNGKWSKTK